MAILLGTTCVLGGVWLWSEVGPPPASGWWSPRVTSLILPLMTVGVLLAVQGAVVAVQGVQPSPRRSDQELLRLLEGPRPVTLCLDCRTAVVVPPCEHCGGSASCLEVRSPADAENARVLLNLAKETPRPRGARPRP